MEMTNWIFDVMKVFFLKEENMCKALISIVAESDKVCVFFNLQYHLWDIRRRYPSRAPYPDLDRWIPVLQGADPVKVKTGATAYLFRRIATQRESGGSAELQQAQVQKIEEWVNKRDFSALLEIFKY